MSDLPIKFPPDARHEAVQNAGHHPSPDQFAEAPTQGDAGAPVNVQLALISHTNNGKTTLARTLLGDDIGEVRDAAHVTVRSEAHTLLTSRDGDRLQLWDTPGFGDSVRLLRRLGNGDNPIGWFLREVFDRYRDRPFWLSQQALRTARDESDVVLYLVNASESPQDAGYLAAEMNILAWLGKPVLVLLNQVGAPKPAEKEQAERAGWSRELARFPLVRQVLPLDAFARCWVHENVFFEALGGLLIQAKAAGYDRLLTAWKEKNAERFTKSMRLTGVQLALAVKDRQAIEPDGESIVQSALRAIGIRAGGPQKQHEKAMQVLIERLDRDIGQATSSLLALHQLDPGAAAKINARVRDNFVVRAPFDRAQAGLLGAVISGATTGLTADLMAGGLTAGLGALLGGAVGAVTFAGAAWGFNSTTDRQTPIVEFTDPFLQALVEASILRYLAIIHFGRGRGNFTESEAPGFWQQHVQQAVHANESALKDAWRLVRANTGHAEGEQRIIDIVTDITKQTLDALYPDTAIDLGPAVLRQEPPPLPSTHH